MNTLTNNVSLIGNLGKDPEIKKFGTDNQLVRFSIATNESYKNKDGDWVENTMWHNVIAWGKLAERCEKTLQKGSKIVMQGRLTQDSYETDKGEKRYVTQITMRDFLMMNRKSEVEEKPLKKA